MILSLYYDRASCSCALYISYVYVQARLYRWKNCCSEICHKDVELQGDLTTTLCLDTWITTSFSALPVF